MITQRTSYWQILKHEADGTPYFERVTSTVEYDQILQQWFKKPELTKVEKLTPEQVGLVKSIEFAIIIQRIATDNYSLLKKIGLFLQKYRVQIPQEKRYRDLYISMPKGAKKPYSKDLSENLGRSCGFCQVISVDNVEFVKKVGNAIRITVVEANRLTQEKKVIGKFKENGQLLEQFLDP